MPVVAAVATRNSLVSASWNVFFFLRSKHLVSHHFNHDCCFFGTNHCLFLVKTTYCVCCPKFCWNSTKFLANNHPILLIFVVSSNPTVPKHYLILCLMMRKLPGVMDQLCRIAAGVWKVHRMVNPMANTN